MQGTDCGDVRWFLNNARSRECARTCAIGTEGMQIMDGWESGCLEETFTIHKYEERLRWRISEDVLRGNMFVDTATPPFAYPRIKNTVENGYQRFWYETKWIEVGFHQHSCRGLRNNPVPQHAFMFAHLRWPSSLSDEIPVASREFLPVFCSASKQHLYATADGHLQPIGMRSAQVSL